MFVRRSIYNFASEISTFPRNQIFSSISTRSISSTTASPTGHGITIYWSDRAEPSYFHARWLWHNRPETLQAGSGQRVQPAWAIPLEASVQQVHLTDDQVQVQWHDGTCSVWPVADLAASDYSLPTLLQLDAAQLHPERLHPDMPAVQWVGPTGKATHVERAELTTGRRPKIDWAQLRDVVPPFPGATAADACAADACSLHNTADDPPANLPTIQWDEYAHSAAGLEQALTQIATHGLVIVQGMPVELGTVRTAAERIAPVQDTIYGQTFDVVAEPGSSPINAAYSTVRLDLHVDLVYYESPPGLQFLHAVRFDDEVTGGESTFQDVFACAYQFAVAHPEAFQLLCTVPISHAKIHMQRARPVHMTYTAPIFQVAPSLSGAGPPQIVRINWSPPFEAPLRVHPSLVNGYYDAYIAWARFMAQKHAQPNAVPLEAGGFMRHRLQQGECAIFNNRRVLHGREEFALPAESKPAAPGQSTYPRHLQGAYVNIDDFRSQLAVLQRKRQGLTNTLGTMSPTVVRGVGNSSWT